MATIFQKEIQCLLRFPTEGSPDCLRSESWHISVIQRCNCFYDRAIQFHKHLPSSCFSPDERLDDGDRRMRKVRLNKRRSFSIDSQPYSLTQTVLISKHHMSDTVLRVQFARGITPLRTVEFHCSHPFNLSDFYVKSDVRTGRTWEELLALHWSKVETVTFY